MNCKILLFCFLLPASSLTQDICKSCNCNLNSEIIQVNCVNQGLQTIGSLWPTENNTKVIKVNFSENNITDLEPLPFTDAEVEIVVSRCNLRHLLPQMFSDTKNVKFADLSYNLLTADELTSEKFKGPYNNTEFEPIALEHLDLSYNQIHSLNKDVFEHMPDLRILNLEGNDFKVLDIHTQLALSSIRKLQSLNLANNELTEMIVGAIQAHDNLTELDLSNNELDFVPNSLANIGKSLQVLKLDGNPIIEFVSETFLGLGNIIELSANNLTNLKYINANTFAPLTKLKILKMSRNFLLTDIDREAFAENQTLEEFYLNNNALYKLDHKLLKWSSLHVFEFDDNSLECSCDLFNISSELSVEITKNRNGPFCVDPRNDRYIEVFSLQSDICDFHERATHIEIIEYHFSMVKLALIVLSALIMFTALLAMLVGFFKYRRYQRQLGYPFASQVSYNRISTAPKF